jgi:response regulator NasT
MNLASFYNFATPLSMMRILIADDEPLIRLDLQQMLESLGHEVVAEAGDGAEAVELAKKHAPEVCILDVRMPIMDGIEATQKITNEIGVPAIMLTAFNDKELVERAVEAGAFAYLVKPFKPSELTPAIEVAKARFDQNALLAKEVASLSERLQARVAVDKAKGILMKSQNLDEAEAYRKIQLQAMNLRKSMREVSEAIILAESL